MELLAQCRRSQLVEVGRDGRIPAWLSSAISPDRWTAASRPLRLQLDYTQGAAGRKGRLFTSHDRAGESTISSRLGLAKPAIEVTWQFDFWNYVVAQLTSGQRIDYLVCDETQFYSAEQVDQLARIADELQIDVFAIGLLTDFQTRLFVGSQRLVELCDRIEILQVRALCWCGERATHNARTVNGVMVLVGDQVVVGDTVPVPDADGEETAAGRCVRGPVSPASPSPGDASRGAGHPL